MSEHRRGNERDDRRGEEHVEEVRARRVDRRAHAAQRYAGAHRANEEPPRAQRVSVAREYRLHRLVHRAREPPPALRRAKHAQTLDGVDVAEERRADERAGARRVHSPDIDVRRAQGEHVPDPVYRRGAAPRQHEIDFSLHVWGCKGGCSTFQYGGHTIKNLGRPH